jgi:redox-sensitive bicupin YhaK (pirin superfamily)
MIRRIAAQKRHLAVTPDFENFLLFSSGDYFEPGNVRWGGLRLFNDDLIRPGGGFPLHFHDEVEVVTIVLAGELRQKQGNQHLVRLRAGDVQTLSSGTGVWHAETNECPEPVHFYQLGIFPRIPGSMPAHAEASFGMQQVPNALRALASGQGKEGAVPMNADATVFTGLLEPCHMIDHDLGSGRSAFVYVTRGMLTVNGVDCESGDQARIVEESGFMIGAIDRSEFVLVDVPTLGQTNRS